MKKQNNQFKAALILLDNVFYNIKKFNRWEFSEVLMEKGIAYSPYSGKHLLNVIAAKMSVYPNNSNCWHCN